MDPYRPPAAATDNRTSERDHLPVLLWGLGLLAAFSWWYLGAYPAPTILSLSLYPVLAGPLAVVAAIRRSPLIAVLVSLPGVVWLVEIWLFIRYFTS
jgi:hypothetical protein